MKQLLTLETLVKNTGIIHGVWEAKEIIGNFSMSTKMPCATYSIPAEYCKTGSILRNVPGSICSDCYACRSSQTTDGKDVGGWYMTERVQQPMTHRLLQVLFNPRWTEAMIYLFQHYKWKFFRWHDSGDIQSMTHFENICKIADSAPGTKFWLPTQEWDLVAQYWEEHGRISLRELHPNLIIRLSAREKENARPPIWLAERIGVQVSKTSPKMEEVDCLAHDHANNCGDCRKCWNYDIQCITYPLNLGDGHVMDSPFVKDVLNHMDSVLSLKDADKHQMFRDIAKKFILPETNVRLIALKYRMRLQKKLRVLESTYCSKK